MLKIENLTKTYGTLTAVDDLTLHIARGEIYGFIGHNGAGKTTTLKAVAGILGFEKGDIFIDGVSVKLDPVACKRKIAYLPDNPDVYEFMTGNGFLNFVADVFGTGEAERKEKINEFAEAFGLNSDLDKPVSSYSHGMKQKLALISAFMHSPELIIMDEPFVGLDPKAAHVLKEKMREHCDRGGSIFFSTHVLDVAEKLCDKVAIIKNGRLVRAGTMDEVRAGVSLEDAFLDAENE
ncbi:MAG TPA: ABC transporter ATP-binding protein [Clostridiales bacterium]|nr:ABC transporter ATP-binding protein [Clostridiales bacterium]